MYSKMELRSVMDDKSAPHVLVLTAKIVSAHVSNNKVPVDGLRVLIQDVHHSLATAGGHDIEPVVHTPAVTAKRSIFPDFIICLEDGKRLKMLKRHLRTLYGLTPDQYRAKWGLPIDYPMVAPNYSRFRSSMAKSLGLGRTAGAETAVSGMAPTVATSAAK